MADNKTSIIISAVDQTGAALKSAEAGLAGLGAQAGRVSGILSGFAALAGATTFGGIIKGAIDAADELDELAQKSGATVESLSAMKGVAKIAGADMEQVAGGLAKLSKNMVEAANGSGDAAKVLTALGVSVTDNAGKMKSTDQVMVEFAKSLQNVGSGTEKVAAAQMVLGKSGAQLLPFLNDLAAAGELQVKVTAEQAAAAANLNDNLNRLSAVHKAWANTVAMEVVPVADVFVKALLETAQGANGTKKAVDDMARDGSLLEWAKSAATAAGWVVDSLDGVVRITNAVGKGLGAMAAQAAALMRGDFKAIGEIEAMYQTDRESIMMAPLFSETLAKRMADLGTTSQAATPGVKSIAAALGDAGEKAAKAAAALADLRMETLLRNAKEAAKELDTLTKQEEEYNKALYAGTDAIEAQAAALEREVAFYGMTESAIQATIIQRLEEARAMAAINGASEAHLLFLEREIDARQRIATASSQKEFLDTNKRAAEDSAREWEKFADDINRSLTDALFRAFESGSGFGKSFADTLGNTLKAAVAKALINVAITTGSNALNTGINALLGTSGANNGAGTNYLGLASNASSMYNLANGSYATAAMAAYSQYQAGIPVAQWSLSNAAPVTTAVNTSGVAANGMANQAGTGAGSSLGGIATGVLAIIAGMYMSSEAWKNGYRADGNWTRSDDPRTYEFALRDIEFEINKALFGEDFAGSEFLAILTGNSLQKQMTEWVQSGIFGRERVTGTQIAGTFSEAEQGFTGRSGVNIKKSGGLFSGSRESTEWSDLPNQVDQIFDAVYRGMRNSFVMLGDVFDDSTLADKIAGFTYAFQVNESDLKVALVAAQNDLAESLGSRLLPSIESLRRTTVESGKEIRESWANAFQRIVAESSVVTDVLDAMGRKMSEVFGRDNADGVLRLSDSLVQLFGGIEALSGSFGAYYTNFYTAAEQNARAWELVDRQLVGAGVTGTLPRTREEFRALVDSLDLAQVEGQRAFKSLMDVSGAFAQLTEAMVDTRRVADSVRREEIAAMRAREQAQAESAAAAATAVAEAMAARMTQVFAGGTAADFEQLARDQGIGNVRGNFSTQAALNYAIATEELRARQTLARDVSAGALNIGNVQDVFGAIAQIPGTIREANAFNTWRSFGGGASDSAALFNFSQIVAGMRLTADNAFAGPGIANVLRQRELLSLDAQIPQMQAYGQQALRDLRGEFAAGTISANDFARAVREIEDQLQVTTYGGTLEALARAGEESIAFYFGQIHNAAQSLAAQAAEAVTPLSQVTAAIGRLNSTAYVFGQSVAAARSAGSSSLNADRADLIAVAAGVASQLVTTRDAAAAAGRLSGTGLFGSSASLRDASLLIDGVAAYDAASFETAFLRINDALAQGSISADQYTALFADAAITLSGYTDQMGALTSQLEQAGLAVKSFADALMVDSTLSPLSAEAMRLETQRQYREALGLAQAGDTGKLDSATRNYLAAVAAGATDGTAYDTAFASTISDLRRVEVLLPRPAKTNTDDVVAAVTALQQVIESLREDQRTGTAATTSNQNKLQRLLEALSDAGEALNVKVIA